MLCYTLQKYCCLNKGMRYAYYLSLVQLWQDYYHMSVAVLNYCCGSVVVMYRFVLAKYTTVCITYVLSVLAGLLSHVMSMT